MNKQDLIAFEDEMTLLFEQGHIKAPLHLAGGNEEALIEIFKEIDLENDWVLCGWRSHYHCLLKGLPPDDLRRAILDGHSISLCFPKHKVLCSGIVGGIAPIAVGIAAGIKRANGRGKVWAFIGDMTARTGIVREATQYAEGHDLPIEFVVENNHLSVCTDTQASWGHHITQKCRIYEYKMTRPHVGIGRHVSF